MFGFDPLYFVWLAPGLRLALWAQWHTQRAFPSGAGSGAYTPHHRRPGSSGSLAMCRHDQSGHCAERGRPDGALSRRPLS